MPDLTVTGTPITDALRALGVQGDGLSADSSFGMWEATTNAINALSDFGAYSAATVSSDATTQIFAASSRKVVTPGAVAQEGARYNHPATMYLPIAASTTYTYSVWVIGLAGARLRLYADQYTGASVFAARASKDFVATGSLQRVDLTYTSHATAARVVLYVFTAALPAQATTYWFGGVQHEQQPLATPFAGYNTTRAAARVQAPASLLDETQFAAAFRVAPGWSTSGEPYGGSGAAYLFDLRDDANNRISGYYDEATNKWTLDRKAAGAGSPGLSGAVTLARDVETTVIFAGTATALKVSVDGGAFSSVANSSIPTLAASLIDLLSQAGTSGHFDGRVKWAALFTGTLTDTDAANLHALGNTDVAPEDFIAAAPASACTATWAADTAAYLDEAFTIIDPDLPHLRVDVDFTNDPTNPTRVWTDVTHDVRGDIRLTRGGRNHVLQRSEGGSLALVLNNRHADYDPTNPDSPHYPGVKRRRWIRVRARVGVTDYPRWQGVIEGWRQNWPGAGHDATVQVTASDATKVLALFDLEGLTFVAQTTGERVRAVLDAAGVTDYTVEDGETDIVAATDPFAQGSYALAHLLQVEESENGLLFAEGDGEIVFQGRHYRLLNSDEPVGVIGEAAGEIRYREGELDLGDDDLWTTVAVTPDGGTAQVATDATAEDAHYSTRLNRSILSSSEAEALSAAQWLLQRFADSAPRVPTIELIGAADPDTWPLILSAGNSDRFTWRRVAEARTLEMDVFVERVADVISLGAPDWRVLIDSSPVVDQQGWVLGDSTYSLLGETTILTY